jgi:hypothetical protein
VGFSKEYFPHVSVKAVGARAIKLGVKPCKPKFTKDQRQALSEAVKKEVSQEQQQYILHNYQNQSRKQIAIHLNISLHLVQRILREYKIVVPAELTKKFHTENSARHLDKAVRASIAKWNDTEFAAKQSQLISDRSKKLWKSEKYRLKVRAGIRRMYANSDLLDQMGKHRYQTNASVRDILHADRPSKNSKLNDRVAAVLSGYGIEFEREYPIGFYRCDFKIGNILLEVNGEYWHSLPRHMKNDVTKTTMIANHYQEYQLKVLWESEFYSVNGIRRLFELLEYVPIEPEHINLKEITFDNIADHKIINKFLSSFHYLGPTKRTKYGYGLLYCGEPIAVATFGSCVRQNVPEEQPIELVRLCRHPRFSNANMLSFFLAKCCRELSKLKKYRHIVAYADERIHDGVVYRACTWRDCGLTAPDYEYRSTNNIPIHKKTLYNRAKAAGLTERQYVELYGYIKTKIGSKRKFVKQL